jgi:hypothetical protein
MALRDKLASRAQPFLEPGETITQIFPTQVGPNPWMIPAFGPIIVMFLSKMRVIAVTDRAVLVFNSSKLTPKPTALLQRLPRQTRLGPIEGKLCRRRTHLGAQALPQGRASRRRRPRLGARAALKAES